MIEFCRTWCEGIIVAVIISMIIETILPEGNHKKYVKVTPPVCIKFYQFLRISNNFHRSRLESRLR